MEEADHSDSHDDDISLKMVGIQGVKSSQKSTTVSSLCSKTRTISKDSSLLIEEQVEGAQAEFDERHQAKISGKKDILQSSVCSTPDATTKCGEDKVITHFSANIKSAQAAHPNWLSKTGNSSVKIFISAE